jgi:PAS domain S-box-containing protein
MLVKKAPISAERHESQPANSLSLPVEKISRVGRLEPRRGQGSRFESFLAAFSATFAGMSGDQAAETIGTWLSKLARLIRVDCVSFWEWDVDDPAGGLICVYSTCETDSPRTEVTTSSRPWLTRQYREGRVVAWPRIPDDIPAEAVAERAWALEVGMKSALEIPILFGKRIYVIAFSTRRHHRTWSRRTIGRLRLAGEVFAQAILREQAGRAGRLARHVARHRESADRLRMSEHSFRAIFEHSAVGIALVAPEGRWLEVNTAVTQLLGYTKSELRDLDFQTLTHADDVATELACVRRALAGETEHYDLEKRYIHKDGRVVTTVLTASLVRDRLGQPAYFIHQLLDITERKQVQAEIARLRAQLAHTGRMSLTSQLTASLAHQLLQPVTAIVANVEAGQHALRAAALPKLSTLEPILQDIGACARAAGEVIERVRSLLRSEPQPLEPLDFDHIVGDVAKLVHSRLILHKIRMIMRLNSASTLVLGDRVQLQQLVLNLLMNAIDAMSDSMVTERLLVVSTATGVREIELTVRDRGVGINAAYLQRMFEPFFTTKPGGMGMGLYLSAEIVRSHGGKIWAENNEGPGLTLHCRLPVFLTAQ